MNTSGCTKMYKTHIKWNLFLDDERDPPNDGRDWIIARNFSEAAALINSRGLPNHMSLDHDLGEGHMTGYDFVKYVVEVMIENGMPEDFTFNVHSMNPIGAKNILEYLQWALPNLEKFK